MKAKNITIWYVEPPRYAEPNTWMKPIMSPPTNAPGKEPSPPSTTTTNAFMRYWSPSAGVNDWNNGTAPASPPARRRSRK